ncbi:hypothetical protein [Lignipirellula cremea]|uniref:Uncharacterized protein n=1 Tax=Lignipirellula cremea TaxID=2528010 RepID=A0A518E2X2_9BACT|nr:hypothetical protein [Lignipirellula cremea]QDU98445.1 hypothetical protein Pla8534_63130 [Lignipirellula cremea]
MNHAPLNHALRNSSSAGRRASAWLCLVQAAALLLLCGPAAWSQAQDVHYQHSADMAPGVVGRLQLAHGGPRPGYFQPVEVWGPPGTHVSFASEGRFQPSELNPVKASMLLGQVYRLKVTRIPGVGNEGIEVYPSIELVNRLYPPHGLEEQYPIPIHLTQAELEYASRGNFVTRVIYLEPPLQAVPVADTPAFQRWYEVGPNVDPLKEADRLGRPMAILRMGSRIPDGAEHGFAFGSPPLYRLKPTPPQEAAELRAIEGQAPVDPPAGAVPDAGPVPPPAVDPLAPSAVDPLAPPAVDPLAPPLGAAPQAAPALGAAPRNPAPRVAAAARAIPSYRADQVLARLPTSSKGGRYGTIAPVSAEVEITTAPEPVRSPLPKLQEWDTRPAQVARLPEPTAAPRRRAPQLLYQMFGLPCPASPTKE